MNITESLDLSPVQAPKNSIVHCHLSPQTSDSTSKPSAGSGNLIPENIPAPSTFGTTAFNCYPTNDTSAPASVVSPSPFNSDYSVQNAFGRIYLSFFGLFERHLTQRMEQFSARLDGFQREQMATKYQLSRIESLLQACIEQRSKVQEESKRLDLQFSQDQTLNNLWNGWSNSLEQVKNSMTNNSSTYNSMHSSGLMKPTSTAFTTMLVPNAPSTSAGTVRLPSINDCLNRTSAFVSSNNFNSHEADLSARSLAPFAAAFQPPTPWHQWMANLFANPPTTPILSCSAIPMSKCTKDKPSESQDAVLDVNNLWPAFDTTKAGAVSLSSYRPFKGYKMRGRRFRGAGRPVWPNPYDPGRSGQIRRPMPFSRSPLTASLLSNGFKIREMNGLMQKRESCGPQHPNAVDVVQETNGLKKQNVRTNDTGRGGGLYSPNRLSMSTQNTKSSNLVGNPIVILNPKEPREIFIGGIHTVKLPLWAYKKCLTMVRGEPHELGPRLCLRLLQSLFSLHYLVTHNYNGSGGKAPIDPTVMGAVLRQAQIQFGSGYFFTEPMALGKLRDYLNNAFRVMAFRQRKGERVRSPFWNDQGEPEHDLDAPAEFAETSDVIVLTQAGDVETDMGSTDENVGEKDKSDRENETKDELLAYTCSTQS